VTTSSDVPSAIAAVLAEYDAGRSPARDDEKAAVKAALAELMERAPGRSVEVRIPPYAAVQVIEGTTHRRGTPSAVVETDPATWLALAVGRETWAAAVARGAVRASGQRSDLGGHLPLFSGDTPRKS